MSRRNQIFRNILLSVLGFAFVLLFLPFHRAILLSIFFAFALDPLTRKLAVHHYLRRRAWVAVTLAAFFFLIAIPFGIAMYNIYDTVQETAGNGNIAESRIVTTLGNAKDALLIRANQFLEMFGGRQLNIRQVDAKLFEGISQNIMAFSTGLVVTLPDFVLTLFVFTAALYFFLAESNRIKRLAQGSGLMPPKELDQLIALISRSCSSILVASMIVGALQASIVAVGGLIFAKSDFFIVFVVTFFFSFIPVIGAAPVGLALALFSLLSKEYGNAIGLTVVALVAGTIDNIVRPWLVGSEEQVHPIIVLLAIIGGIVIFGLPGLFLGPLIATVTLRVFARYVYNDENALDANKS